MCEIMAEQDIAMNQFQIVTDADYVYVEKGNNQGKIKKSDFIRLMADSLLIKEPISIVAQNGIEVNTGISGTHIISIFYIENGISNFEHIISISYIGGKYEVKTLVSTWYSENIETRMEGNKLFITQNGWDSMPLYFRILR